MVNVLSNLLLTNPSIFLYEVKELPTNAQIGQFCFFNSILYVYGSVNSVVYWVPLTSQVIHYIHTQDLESVEWNITHNLDSINPYFVVFDMYDDIQLPVSVVYDDNKSFTLNFSFLSSGKVIVFPTLIES